MKKRSVLIVFAILVISFISFTNFVGAEDLSDLQNRRNELQEQISSSNEQIEDIQIELTENLEQLNTLNQKIAAYEEEIIQLEENLSKINSEIETISARLAVIEENYNNQRNVLQNRIVALYESGDVYFLDVLLKSNSFSDFVSNYFMIGEIARYDNDLLVSIETQKTQIETIKNTLNERKTNLDTLKSNKEKTAISLENSKIIRNSYITKLTNDEKEMQEKIDRYTQELNSLDSQITALTVLSIGEDYVGGEFIWPAPGYSTITSKFGMRYHPVLKVYSLHKGTDIAVPMGSYVVASNDGTVISSTYATGYGNMIMIDHGGGIVTLYGHGSELIAKLGDQVKKGDLIMKSGSTGWSTGPHLHFEVRFNGKPIDSLEFLNNQSMYLNAQDESQTDLQTNETSVETNETDGGQNQ